MSTMANSSLTKSQEMGNVLGKRGDSTRVNGIDLKCTARER
jgi:hypothetical protein